MTTTIDRRPDSRIRVAWTAAHRAVPGVPRWQRVIAHLIPAVVLPSSLWRVAAFTFEVPILSGHPDVDDASSGVPALPLSVYVIILSVVSELFAFTAVGLVASWGETVPRWVPWLRGRPIPRLAVVIPAATGSVLLTLLWTWVTVAVSIGRGINGKPLAGGFPVNFDDWQGLLAFAAYAPLILWGPLLAALTVGYWRRHARV